MEPNNLIYDTIVQAREKQANAKSEYEDEYLNDLKELEDDELSDLVKMCIKSSVIWQKNTNVVLPKS